MSNHSASFGITNAKQFLDKLHEEQKDFEASDSLSARHALNAIITAYHLHEWVWGEWLQKRQDLRKEWGVNSPGEFGRRLANQYCLALEDARKITNGAKHFENRIVTGHHRGVFQRGVFQKDAFNVSRLWIDRGDKSQLAEDFNVVTWTSHARARGRHSPASFRLPVPSGEPPRTGKTQTRGDTVYRIGRGKKMKLGDSVGSRLSDLSSRANDISQIQHR